MYSTCDIRIGLGEYRGLHNQCRKFFVGREGERHIWNSTPVSLVVSEQQADLEAPILRVTWSPLLLVIRLGLSTDWWGTSGPLVDHTRLGKAETAILKKLFRQKETSDSEYL